MYVFIFLYIYIHFRHSNFEIPAEHFCTGARVKPIRRAPLAASQSPYGQFHKNLFFQNSFAKKACSGSVWGCSTGRLIHRGKIVAER